VDSNQTAEIIEVYEFALSNSASNELSEKQDQNQSPSNCLLVTSICRLKIYSYPEEE